MEKDDIRIVLGNNLTRLMTVNKHSQGYVHNRVGVAQSTVGRIRRGEVSTTIETIEQIAKLYGLSPWQLLVPNLDVGNPPMLRALSDKEKEFYEKLKNLVDQ